MMIVRIAAGDLADRLDDLLSSRGVEARGRLIEDEQLGIVHQRGGDAHAREHPGGEALEPLRGGAREVDRLQQAGELDLRALAGHPQDAADELQVADRRLVAREGRVGGEEADASPQVGALGRHRLAEHGEPPGGRALQPQQQAEGRRLAGAVGSDQAVDRPLLHAHGERVQRDVALLVDLREVGGLDDRHGSPPGSPFGSADLSSVRRGLGRPPARPRPGTLRPMQRVLLVSDSAVHVAVAESVLRAEGLLLRHETSLPGGLAVAREWRPALVILDLAVPLERDGAHAEPALAGRVGAASQARLARRAKLTPAGLGAVLRDSGDRRADARPRHRAAGAGGTAPPRRRPRRLRARAPLDDEELRVRVLRALARAGGEGGSVLRRAGVVIDLERYTVTVDGEVVDLTYKEYELLAFLAGSPGRPFTREALLDRVWGYDYYGGARTVDVHVRRIRSKIEGRRQYIETVRNVGYRFVEL